VTSLPTGPGSVPVARHVDEGTVFWSMGNRFTLKLGARDTTGQLGLLEVVAPVGTAPPLHVHHREAEVFYLLEGTMIYRAGDETFELAVGSSIYLPKDVPHAFRVTGRVPARFLALTVPGGLEALYGTLGRPPDHDGMPNPPSPEEIGNWLQTTQQYGLEVIGPPLPEPA
jgi:mannose-6-phosphate isomerase-like protein (cupin superfamily)